MNTIFCILGRSAVGKDTLVNAVCKELGLKKVISRTTRAPRQGETEGVNYFFSVEQDFFDDMAANIVCAHTQIGDNYYWANEYDIFSADIYIIDPKGLYSLQEHLRGTDTRIISIYITAPIDDTFRRGYTRSPHNFEDFENKVSAENEQFTLYETLANYDYCVHNVHFNITKEQLKLIIEREMTNNVF